MSAANTLEAKKVRRKAREVRHENTPQTYAEYDFCVITGKWAPTDLEHGISKAGWRKISEYLYDEHTASLVGAQDVTSYISTIHPPIPAKQLPDAFLFERVAEMTAPEEDPNGIPA